MVPSDNVTPPVFWPYSRTWNLDGACFAESSASLNVTVSWPEPVRYTADVNSGLIVSYTVTAWFSASAFGLPAVSVTAPADMYSRGSAMSFTEFV